MVWQTFGISFILSLLLIPAIRWIGIRVGKLSSPRRDRWHKAPTPNFGGVGIFLAFLVALLVFGGDQIYENWGLLVGAAMMFLIGFYDDLRPLSPPAKLVGQIMAAAIIVYSGITTQFFASDLLNIPISVVWLVGITNAINLLDNMDGLAGGISFIATGFLSYFFFQSANPAGQPLLLISMALLGSILGFLVYNFPPASIFMGDSGSLFLGTTMAALAIARTPQASNVFVVMSVPTLLFLLPILDTAFVTVTRLLRGQSPAKGGRDHTSHRLVAFGLTERQAVIILYIMAVTAGVAGAVLESLDYRLSLLLIPILVIAFSLLAAYLGRVKVIDTALPERRGVLSSVFVELTYRRRLLEIALDFFLISTAFYLAFWTRYGFLLDDQKFALLLNLLPVALGSVYLSFFVFRVYRGVWQFFGVGDFSRVLVAGLVSTIIVSAVQILFFPQEIFSVVTSFLFLIYLFFGIVASRTSFRILDDFFGRKSKEVSEEKGVERVLIFDASDKGELTLRWLGTIAGAMYQPVGFIDNDPFKWGRQIHGVDVLGGVDKLENILTESEIGGLVIPSGVPVGSEQLEAIIAICKTKGIWVRQIHINLKLLV